MELAKQDKSVAYQLIENKRIDNNITQSKYQLYKDGVKVRGGEYVINHTNGRPDFLNGLLAPFEIGAKNSFKISKEAAIKIGQSYFNENGKITSTFNSIEQIYYFNYNTHLFTLSFEVLFNATNSIKAEKVFIGCDDATILGSESLMCNVNFPGFNISKYEYYKNNFFA